MLGLRKMLFLSTLIGIVLLATVTFADSAIKVMIDDKELVTNVPPIIQEDRTLVPLRAIFEALGASVEWDASTNTVTAKKDSLVIILKINDKYPTVNGKQQELDVPATVINDRTMVPVRFIATSLGEYVEWDDTTQTVNIITPKVINFKDQNLEKLIREKINVPTGDIKNTDVRNIVKLNASDEGIENIEGIENLCSLMDIDLSHNNIINIVPLKSLGKIVELNLSNNKISNIYYLKDLSLLNTLDVSANQIKDINVLNDMPNLKKLQIKFNPLNNYSSLLKLSENTDIYLLDKDYPISKANENALKEYEQVINKAYKIINEIIKPEMTDIEKEFALHDYLAVHTIYDNESYVNLKATDTCHSAYGALIQGKAVCDGYAKAMEIMLNMVGVECITVTGSSFSYEGRPIGHAWNIVKIDGAYYHMDVTMDDSDGEYGELNHYFLNLSDNQIKLSHNWDKNSYPKCVNDNKDYNSITNMFNSIIYAKNDLFKVGSGNLYKIDTKTSIASKMTDDKVSEIQILDDWIYYINVSDQQRIYKIKTDGTGKTKVNEESCAHIIINGDSMFYITTEACELYKFNITKNSQSPQRIDSGVDFITNIFKIDNYVYYRYFTWSMGSGFKVIKDESTRGEMLVKDTPAGFKKSFNNEGRASVSTNFAKFERVSEGYLYYISTQENNQLYRVKLDGTHRERLCSDNIDSLQFEVVGNYIYYQNSNDNKTYRVDVDGHNRICIE